MALETVKVENLPVRPPMSEAEKAALPPAVRAAAEKAEAIQRGLAQQPAVTPPGNPTPTPPPMPPPPPGFVPTNQPPAPPPAPLAEMTEAEVTAFLAEPAEPGSDLARVQHQLRSQIGRTKALERQLASAARPTAPVQVAPLLAPVGDVPDLELPAEIVEQFGSDLVNLVSQIADHRAKRESAAVLKQVAPALQGVAVMTVQQLQEQAKSAVNAAVAAWGTSFDLMDGDAGFNNWLALTDRFSSVTRKQLFLNAWSRGNADALVAMMTAYLQEVAPLAAQQPTPIPPAGTPPVPAARPVVPLDALAAPGRAPNPTPPPPTQGQIKETYKASDVKQFYDRKRRGEFAGHEAEVAQTELEIAVAIREGRVIPNA